ncbi:MAG: ABC transporter substrate-binding protein [Promethearchaeota archaeon]|jgi:ABC-type branched-subunit amino acid transport system substrate-binding protein
MESKRIIAIVVIVAAIAGIGFGAWYFLLAPGAGAYVWTAADAPGAPPGTPADRIIKIGAAGDTGEIQGDANIEGIEFACKTINEAGGIQINGSTYYFGFTSEDTDEVNTNLVTSRGVDAARRLIFNKKVDFAIGGFRSEALLAYVEEFMDEQIMFIDTGAATDVFCTNVITNYARYKYFWRFMPINSTSLGGQILGTLAGFILTMNATYPNQEVKQVGILAEDLTWVTALVGAMSAFLGPLTGGWAEVLTPILYDITLSATDMNTHLASLQSQGADIVIPVISAQGGILMMQQYAANEYDSYETIMQTLHRTNKTASSVAFWDAFVAEYAHEPLYIAVGSYDAVMAIKDAILVTQSLSPGDLIPYMESWTKSNPHPGASGDAAWWPTSHDLVAGYPYAYTLWCQWQPGGAKTVIPAGIYPDTGAYGTIVNGPYIVAPWVNATWF